MKSQQIARAEVDLGDEGKATLSHVRITLNDGTEYDELALLRKGRPVDVIQSGLDAEYAAKWFRIISTAPIVDADEV